MNCTTDNCERPMFTKGVCEWHYRKQHKRLKPNSPCVIDSCKNNGAARGLCQPHYQKARLAGTLQQYERQFIKNQVNISGYKSYRSMLARCYNPNNSHYKDYGGRGIKVCDEWRGWGGFKVFYEYIGLRPSARHSVDRIDNDGNYEPGNVRWATPHEQAANTRRNSEHIGVYYAKDRNMWLAHLTVDGANVINRYYDTKDEAIAVRKFAEEIFLKNRY